MITEEEIVKIMIEVGEADAWRFAKTDPFFNEERVSKVIAMQTEGFLPVAKLMATAIVEEINKRL